MIPPYRCRCTVVSIQEGVLLVADAQVEDLQGVWGDLGLSEIPLREIWSPHNPESLVEGVEVELELDGWWVWSLEKET